MANTVALRRHRHRQVMAVVFCGSVTVRCAERGFPLTPAARNASVRQKTPWRIKARNPVALALNRARRSIRQNNWEPNKGDTVIISARLVPAEFDMRRRQTLRTERSTSLRSPSSPIDTCGHSAAQYVAKRTSGGIAK